MRYWLIVVTLMISTATYARMGETHDECIQRYGKPENDDLPVFPTMEFKKGDIIIQIHLDASNRVDSITYQRETSFSTDEIQALLKLNTNETWQSAQPDSLGETDISAPTANWKAHISETNHVVAIATISRLKELATQRERDRSTPIAKYGQLGQTAIECVNRYGPPTGQIEQWIIFRIDDLKIVVNLNGSNRVDELSYERERSFSEKELHALLKNNANETWMLHPSADNEIKGEAPIAKQKVMILQDMKGIYLMTLTRAEDIKAQEKKRDEDREKAKREKHEAEVRKKLDGL